MFIAVVKYKDLDRRLPRLYHCYNIFLLLIVESLLSRGFCAIIHQCLPVIEESWVHYDWYRSVKSTLCQALSQVWVHGCISGVKKTSDLLGRHFRGYIVEFTFIQESYSKKKTLQCLVKSWLISERQYCIHKHLYPCW